MAPVPLLPLSLFLHGSSASSLQALCSSSAPWRRSPSLVRLTLFSTLCSLRASPPPVLPPPQATHTPSGPRSSSPLPAPPLLPPLMSLPHPQSLLPPDLTPPLSQVASDPRPRGPSPQLSRLQLPLSLPQVSGGRGLMLTSPRSLS